MFWPNHYTFHAYERVKVTPVMQERTRMFHNVASQWPPQISSHRSQGSGWFLNNAARACFYSDLLVGVASTVTRVDPGQSLDPSSIVSFFYLFSPSRQRTSWLPLKLLWGETAQCGDRGTRSRVTSFCMTANTGGTMIITCPEVDSGQRKSTFRSKLVLDTDHKTKRTKVAIWCVSQSQ